MKYNQILIAAVLFIVNITSFAFAREVTLYWEPSPSPDVAGYRIYYQPLSPQLPLAGTGADQGPSPLDVENSLMATISGLQETAVYYFTVTAYDSDKNESGFSNIVATAWMPPLHWPQKESIVIPWNVTFEWEAGPHQDLNYILYYGTDKEQVNKAAGTPYAFDPFPRKLLPEPTPTFFIIIALLLLLTTWLTSRRAGSRPAYIGRSAVAGLALFALVACGEGGGSGTGDSLSSTASMGGEAPSPSATLTRIDTGPSTSYQTSSLESGTTYYWKVDAYSTSAPETVYHSEMYSFTTQ